MDKKSVRQRKDGEYVIINEKEHFIQKGLVKMKLNKKLISLCLSILFLISVTFSISYVESHTLHDCTGDSCSVCVQLHIFENLLNAMKGVIVIAAWITMISVCYIHIIKSVKVILYSLSLITLKVKLTD